MSNAVRQDISMFLELELLCYILLQEFAFELKVQRDNINRGVNGTTHNGPGKQLDVIQPTQNE